MTCIVSSGALNSTHSRLAVRTCFMVVSFSTKLVNYSMRFCNFVSIYFCIFVLFAATFDSGPSEEAITRLYDLS